MKRLILTLAALGLLAGPAAASALVGTWKTEPDAKRQTGWVQIVPCGTALCGTLVSAWNQAGQQITTVNVGRRILWDVIPASAGSQAGGRIYVPIMRTDFPVKLKLNGDNLNLRACNSVGVCRSQTWTRVK